MNCFVNIPIDYYRILVVLGDKEETLKHFFDLIEYELATTPEYVRLTFICTHACSPRKSVVTLLMVLRNLLFAAAEVREYAFQRLFPGRDLDAEAEERARTEAKVNIEYVADLLSA
jgi:hypothetical protein